MPPKYLLSFGLRTPLYFDRMSDGFYWRKTRIGRIYLSPRSRNLENLMIKNNSVSQEFTDFLDLVLKMMKFDPNTRIKAQDVLNHKFFKDC